MVSPDNAQGEYYLTDVVEVLAEAGHRVVTVVADDADETHGINDRAQLAHAEAELRSRTNADWLAKGVTMVDPAATYIDTTVSLAADVTLFPGTILQGRTTIGEGVEIGPGCRLIDCTVGEHTTLEHTVAHLSDIGNDCHIGPYAALEPGAHIPPGTRTGPFYTAGAVAALDD
jgi:bifunctional UDP-N-acetylglucosamine pyrophosphorylase/glucosamine-1-phosphate N-acetyltransferase